MKSSTQRYEELRRQHSQAIVEAHITATPVLTPEQRALYAELRGYGSGEGHDGHSGHGGH